MSDFFEEAMNIMSCSEYESFIKANTYVLNDLRRMSGYEECYSKAIEILSNILPFECYLNAEEFVSQIQVSISMNGTCSFKSYNNLLYGAWILTTPPNELNCGPTNVEHEVLNFKVDYIMYCLKKICDVKFCREFFIFLVFTYDIGPYIEEYFKVFYSRPDDLRALENICCLCDKCGFYCYDFENISLFKYLDMIWDGGGYFRDKASPTACIDGIMFLGEDSYDMSISESLMNLECKSFFGFSDLEWKCLKEYLSNDSYSILEYEFIGEVLCTLPYFNAKTFIHWYDIVESIAKRLSQVDWAHCNNFFRLLNTAPSLSMSLFNLFSLDNLWEQHFIKLITDDLSKVEDRDYWMYSNKLKMIIDEYLNSPTINKLSFVPIMLVYTTDNCYEWLYYIHKAIPSKIWMALKDRGMYTQYNPSISGYEIDSSYLDEYKHTIEEYKSTIARYEDTLKRYYILY